MFRLKKRLKNIIEKRPGDMTLYDAIPGKRYKILRVEGGCRLNSRLCSMGLMPGEIFTVYAYSRGGPVCISVKGSRFAVGRGMMGRVIIREA
jgi:ferrous iron transport protein A